MWQYVIKKEMWLHGVHSTITSKSNKSKNNPWFPSTSLISELKSHAVFWLKKTSGRFPVDNVTNFDKIDYCLMSDIEGKVWGFGQNSYGQLGLGHLYANIDTSDPILLP